MHPIICSLGPIKIYSYGLMLVAAFFIATYLAERQAKKIGLDPEIVWNTAFIGTLAGIGGARIFYVLENLAFYLQRPLEIILLQHGGLSWFGGLIFGLLAGLYYLKKKKQPVYITLDLWAPYLALAQSIGRLGCFLNGCCFGKPSAWGIYFPAHAEVLVPIQLYSSLILFLIFIALQLLQARPHRQGSIIYAYLLLYSIKRFIIEFFRMDNPHLLFGLTLFQFIAVIQFFFSLIKLFSLKTSKS